ncbi:hypothetical protein CWC05_06745 [Pseudoalteromonas ruthenica]|uniref:Phage abortive infection protein n=1 Tax=Pseudoalteromonas ruthenica TaxID=151081 RepID=A0A5S3Z5L7_9GAMM|nr:hypothetical protein [Pseudoalteromonas ruthenica]TMP87549.1 hypothetical protein CWC05_06745 [Pseudoalteromonas ruthenica]
MKKITVSDTSAELLKWHNIFKLFFYVTPIIAALFFIIQLYATKSSYSTDFNSLENWMTFTETFNLPISIFTAMAAITTLIGMYYRSLQLAYQLNKVEYQIEIANKQFRKSEDQFNLAQQHFELASRKENFMLYLEHKKAVQHKIKIYLSSLINTCDALMDKCEFFPALDIHYSTLYAKLFNQNSTANVTHFDLEIQSGSFQFPEIEIKKLLKELSTSSPGNIHPKDLSEILDIYGKIGIHFDFNMYPGEGLKQGEIWAASFFLDLMRATMVLHNIRAIDLASCDYIQNLCVYLSIDIISLQTP